jgi:PAS domain S-box-containing protein
MGNMGTNDNKQTKNLKLADAKLCEKAVFTLLRSEQLNSVLSMVSDGLWEWDVANGFFFINLRFSEILGYKYGEMPENKNTWTHLIHFEDYPIFSSYFEQEILNEDQKEVQIEFRIKCQTGIWKWVRLKGRVLEKNNYTGIHKMGGILIDLSYQKIIEDTLRENERRLMQQNEELLTVNEDLAEANIQMQEINRQLILAKEKAIESDKLKSAFLANMSHEIRTPLNGIVGFANMLKEPSLSRDAIDQYIQIINTSSFQLLAIIEDIIDISKIEAGEIKINTVRLHLNNLLDELYSVHELSINTSAVKLTLQTQFTSADDEILADGVRLRQVLTNLITNAIKFTTEGEIKFGYTVDKDFLVFYVSDSGIGIAKENQQLIFERFRQINNQEKGKNAGTGLGLSICKALVELMGGKIWIESELQKGTTFYFTLPLTRVSTNKVEMKEELPLSENIDWTGKTILIAEDEELNFIYLNELLNSYNCQIIWAENGNETVKKCEENSKIDLILMDLKMPILNGYEAARQIRKTHPNLPIIAQTAYAMTDDRQKALEAGCNNYITKPIDKTTLLEMINFFFSKELIPKA